MDLDDAAIVEEEDAQNTSGMVGFDDNPLICCRSALPRIFALFQRRYVFPGRALSVRETLTYIIRL